MWADYAQLAAHYYVTGRFAAMAGYVPTCGNLMHHAFELLLKGGLIKAGRTPAGVDLDEYLRKTYSHKLGKLWPDFKMAYLPHNLTEFDELMSFLDVWEEIRYPRRGIAMSVTRVLPPQTAEPSTVVNGVKVYHLNIPTADRCIQRLWAVSSISPEWFEIVTNATQRPLAASFYTDDNHSVIYA